MRCQCLTLKKEQCKRDAIINSQFCKQHKDCQTIKKISKQKIGKKPKISKKMPVKPSKGNLVSLEKRLANIEKIANIMSGVAGFDDIGNDDGHTDFAYYLAGRGYDPIEMTKTALVWDEDYETSTDPWVTKLNQLRKDFIEDGQPEFLDAFRVGLSHTWPELGLQTGWEEFDEILGVPEGIVYSDLKTLSELSKLPQYQ